MSNENCAETGPHFNQGHVGHVGYKDLKQCCVGIWGIYLNSPDHKYRRECRLIASQDQSIPFSNNFTETIEDIVDLNGRITSHARYRSRFLTLQEWKKVWETSALLKEVFPEKNHCLEGGHLWIPICHTKKEEFLEETILAITPRVGLVEVTTYYKGYNSENLKNLLEKIKKQYVKNNHQKNEEEENPRE